MAEVAKISSKGQVVIPSSIREFLGLEIGSSVAVECIDGFVLLKKIDVPDIMKEFKSLAKLGSKFAKNKGLKEEDIVKIIHKGRGIKSG